MIDSEKKALKDNIINGMAISCNILRDSKFINQRQTKLIMDTVYDCVNCKKDIKKHSVDVLHEDLNGISIPNGMFKIKAIGIAKDYLGVNIDENNKE